MFKQKQVKYIGRQQNSQPSDSKTGSADFKKKKSECIYIYIYIYIFDFIYIYIYIYEIKNYTAAEYWVFFFSKKH